MQKYASCKTKCKKMDDPGAAEKLHCIAVFQHRTKLPIVIQIGLHSTGPSVAGTALGRGWYDGTSFAGKKFRRESPAPGMSDIGTSFAGGPLAS